MKYELVLKYTEDMHEPFEVKYRCVVNEFEYAWTKKVYENYIKEHEGNGLHYVLFTHQLDDEGNFGEVIDNG